MWEWIYKLLHVIGKKRHTNNKKFKGWVSMFLSINTKKFLIVTVVTLSIVVTGCANTQNNLRQQSAPGSTILGQPQSQQPKATADNKIKEASAAAARITKIKGVRSANVLVTQRNAYVAAVLDTNAQISRSIEDQIAAQVRATDPNIQNVYVSTSPELVDRFNAYVRDVQQGRPVSGFVNEFNAIVQRIFPKAK
jgi:YhcN/YlaJ family sporulation lipoprotein